MNIFQRRSSVAALRFLLVPCFALAFVQAISRGDSTPVVHLSPLKEGTWTYDIIGGEGKGKTVSQVVKLDKADAAAPWRRIFSANNVIAHLREEPDGSIVMTGNEIVDRGVINSFDPPQVVVPAPSALGSALNVTSKVSTFLRSRPKMQVDHGTSKLTITPGIVETVNSPAGSFTCRHIDVQLHLTFGLGHVESTANLDYADNVGLVAENYVEKVTSFYISSTTKRKILLKAFPH